MTISVQESMRSLITHNGVTAAYSFTFQVESTDDVRVHVLVPDGTETELTNPTHFSVALAASVPGGTVTLVSPGTYPNLSKLRISRGTDPVQAVTLANTGGHFPGEVERALDRLVKLVQEIKTRSDRSLAQDRTDETAYDAGALRIKDLAEPVDGGDAATMAWVMARILEAEASGGNIASLSALAADILVLAAADDWLDELGFTATGKALIAAASAAAARTTLGASTVGGNVFTAASGQAAMQAMGIAGPVSVALDTATSIPTLLDELGVSALVPYQEEIDNGDFKVWQTGNTRTGATTFPNNDASRFADRWILLSDGNDAVDIAASSSLGYPTGCNGVAEFEAVNTNKWGFLQYQESVRSISKRGKVVGVSFFGARISNLADFRVHLVSWSGTADAPTRDIISAWGAATAKPTPIVGVTLVDATAGSTFTLTLGAYAQHFFTFTVPNDCNNLGIFIGTNDGAYAAGDKVVFSGISRSLALVATRYQSRPMAAELAACERFFTKTFDLETVPAASAGLLGALMDVARNGNSVSASWQFRNRMLKTPTITTYNPEAAGTGWEQVGGGQTFARTIEAVGQSGCHIHGNDSGASGERYAIHATADCEF